MNKAADAYSQISKTETNSAFVKEQALYKLAKCHETAGLKGSREPQNAELAKALECYWELFFSHNDKRKQGIQTNLTISVELAMTWPVCNLCSV